MMLNHNTQKYYNNKCHNFLSYNEFVFITLNLWKCEVRNHTFIRFYLWSQKSMYGLLNESETARSIKDTQLDLRLMTYVAKEQKIFMLKLLVKAL